MKHILALNISLLLCMIVFLLGFKTTHVYAYTHIGGGCKIYSNTHVPGSSTPLTIESCISENPTTGKIIPAAKIIQMPTNLDTSSCSLEIILYDYTNKNTSYTSHWDNGQQSCSYTVILREGTNLQTGYGHRYYAVTNFKGEVYCYPNNRNFLCDIQTSGIKSPDIVDGPHFSAPFGNCTAKTFLYAGGGSSYKVYNCIGENSGAINPHVYIDHISGSFFQMNSCDVFSTLVDFNSRQQYNVNNKQSGCDNPSWLSSYTFPLPKLSSHPAGHRYYSLIDIRFWPIPFDSGNWGGVTIISDGYL